MADSLDVDALILAIGQKIQYPTATWLLFSRLFRALRQQQDENAALAAWQCPHRDGSCLTNDEYGHQYCAKDAEIVRLRTELSDIKGRAVKTIDLVATEIKSGGEKGRLRTEIVQLRAFVAAYDQWDRDDIATFGSAMERMQAARKALENKS